LDNIKIIFKNSVVISNGFMWLKSESIIGLMYTQ